MRVEIVTTVNINIMIRDMMSCRLVDGTNILEESVASIFREEMSPVDKSWNIGYSRLTEETSATTKVLSNPAWARYLLTRSKDH
jgi:hypothetical protein